MSEHTPGPWKRDGNTIYALTELNHRGRALPVNRFWVSVYAGEQCSQEEAEANAALIARAPELLDQLTAAQSRVAELEKEVKGWKNLLRAEGDSAVKQVADLTADNQRLRELLREAEEWLDYPALRDRIKAVIGDGE